MRFRSHNFPSSVRRRYSYPFCLHCYTTPSATSPPGHFRSSVKRISRITFRTHKFTAKRVNIAPSAKKSFVENAVRFPPRCVYAALHDLRLARRGRRSNSRDSTMHTAPRTCVLAHWRLSCAVVAHAPRTTRAKFAVAPRATHTNTRAHSCVHTHFWHQWHTPLSQKSRCINAHICFIRVAERSFVAKLCAF